MLSFYRIKLEQSKNREMKNIEHYNSIANLIMVFAFRRLKKNKKIYDATCITFENKTVQHS